MEIGSFPRPWMEDEESYGVNLPRCESIWGLLQQIFNAPTPTVFRLLTNLLYIMVVTTYRIV